jgi:anti-sigma factor RsiW
MAPKLSLSIVGALVGATSEPYEFTDEVTKEQRAGTVRHLWVSQSFDADPVQVKVRDDAQGAAWFDQACKGGLGTPLSLVAKLQQFAGREASLVLVDLKGVAK